MKFITRQEAYAKDKVTQRGRRSSLNPVLIKKTFAPPKPPLNPGRRRTSLQLNTGRFSSPHKVYHKEELMLETYERLGESKKGTRCSKFVQNSIRRSKRNRSKWHYSTHSLGNFHLHYVFMMSFSSFTEQTRVKWRRAYYKLVQTLIW